MNDRLAWRMILNEKPGSVFCALVQVTTRHGRLCGVHDFGRSVRFKPRQNLAGPVLEVRLTPTETGTLLEVVPAGWSRVQIEAEAESIGSLVHQLREHFDDSPSRLALVS
jgi:hypothetical protein